MFVIASRIASSSRSYSERTCPLISQWRSTLRASAATTLHDYRVFITRFITWRQDGIAEEQGRRAGKSPTTATLKDLTRDLISLWVRALEKTRSERFADRRVLSTKTVITHRAALSAFCSWLVERELLTANPCAKAYRPKIPKSDPVYMNRKQWRLFLEESEAYDLERADELAAKPFADTTFWIFLVATGATTYSEGCIVRPADVHVDEDPTSNMVRVYLKGTKTANRTRDVWISRSVADRVLAWARRYGRGHFEHIFHFKRNCGYHFFRKVCDRLVARGYPDFEAFNPYTLRHTYAVNMIQGDPERNMPGVDIVTLARLMGHGDNIQTTMIYAKHVGDYAARGCRVMHEALGL
ncbi:MAG: site-specific integrase [Gemmatimonadota bacterium]